MSKMIFVNLAVRNLPKARVFYEALGATNNPQFSDETAACMGDSRAAVNAMADAAGKAGGVADINPPQDHGFMFGRSFEDPDGHVWEVIWMDPNGMPARG